ncbi:MAG: peptide-methionine (S)-S-oxide reductase MsrA [Finegoldia sp.]|nr:peptide-methionine (S)-S-oxide reductase MsrA [Finegoldia sp.]
MNKNIIYLAGGCFWGVEGYFQKIDGVVDTEVGYANGKTDKTNYHAVKLTDHAETLKVTYDSDIISLEDLLVHYFRLINPTSINKQGNDRGRQYRTGIYSEDDTTRNRIQLSLDKLQERYDEPIAIENEVVNNYVKAEDYHQDYLLKNPLGYCHVNLKRAEDPLSDDELALKADPEDIEKLYR